MSTDQPIVLLRAHATATLRQARAFSVGSSDRNELRQLAIAIRWLERKGSHTAQSQACRYLLNGNVIHATARGTSIIVTQTGEEEVVKFFKPNDEGNEPAPLILIGVALVPLLGVLGWAFGFFS